MVLDVVGTVVVFEGTGGLKMYYQYKIKCVMWISKNKLFCRKRLSVLKQTSIIKLVTTASCSVA